MKPLIHGGLVSVTFRKLSADEIIALVRGSGLTAIEWGGDVHVPHGNLGAAREVGQRTRDAGLEIAAYGSYYTVAESELAGLTFERVLETAIALGAPLIRVWAGGKSPKDADVRYRERVASETRRIAERASPAGIRIAFEYHGNTLTETPESAVALLTDVAHANVFTYWQASHAGSPEERIASLPAILPRLANIHVFNLQRAGSGWQRRPLIEGEGDWMRDLTAISRTGRRHCALLEFVQHDDPANFLRDAVTLHDWLARLSLKG